MDQYILFAILCCSAFVGSTNAALLNSPCPNVFTYEGEPENDRWFGIMTFSSNIELVGLNYKIQLDRPAQLLVSWDGEVRSDDNVNFNVFDPKHLQRPGEVVKSRIMVKFHSASNPPTVVRIIINGNIMCSGDGGYNNAFAAGLSNEQSTTTVRPDPTFISEEDKVPSGYASYRPNNQNTYSTNEKDSRPNTYDSINYNGGGTGTNYNTFSGSSNNPNNYGQGETNSYPSIYANSGNANSKPSYTNNNNNNNNPNSYGGLQSGYSSNTATNFGPTENVVYPSNQQLSAENQQTSFVDNRNGSGQVNNGPVVTTLTLPNNTQNKNNVDTIIQIIKNQLEQQQGASNTNNTVIVALVSPVNANNLAVQQSAPITSQSRDSLIETTTHKATTTNTQPSVVAVSKVRSTSTPSTTPTKNPNPRNKD